MKLHKLLLNFHIYNKEINGAIEFDKRNPRHCYKKKRNSIIRNLLSCVLWINTNLS